MKLRDAILLSLAVGFLIIGVHQTMTFGFIKAYWALMLSLVLFFSYSLLKGSKKVAGQNPDERPKPGKKLPLKRNSGKSRTA